MKFLTIKDPHFLYGFQPPSSRINFFESMDLKLNFINKYIIDNNINYLFFTGDVFDEQLSSKWGLKQILENEKILKTLKINLKQSPYSILGNHDMLSGRLSIKDTVFEYYNKLNLLNYFGDEFNKVEEQKFVIDENGGKIYFYGIDYKKNWETLQKELVDLNLELEDKDEKSFVILFIHENVVEKQGKEKFECVDYQKLTQFSNIDMWVLGHYHKGYPYTIINNKHFINNWNLTRLTRNEYTLDESHTPEFSDITISFDKEFKIDVKTIKIPCLSYKETFDEEVQNLLKNLQKDFKSLDNFKNVKFEEENDDDNLSKIIKDLNLDQKVLDKAIYYLNNN